MHNRLTVIIIFSVAILFSSTLYQDADAITSLGTKNPKTLFKLVCGDELCQKPMSSDEKIGIYLIKLLQEKNPTISQQSRFAMSGVLQQGLDPNHQKLTADDTRLFDMAVKKLQKAGIDVQAYLSSLDEGSYRQSEISQQGVAIKPKLPAQVVPNVPKKEIPPSTTNKDYANKPILEDKKTVDNNAKIADMELLVDCTNLTPGAKLTGCDLRGMDLSGKDLRGADLSGANLSGEDLGYANLSGAILVYADLSYANIHGANLHEAILTSANLNFANLNRAILTSADLSKADLIYAILSSSNLSYADLSNADLRSADLSNADLSNADLDGADLSGANLTGCTGYSGCHD